MRSNTHVAQGSWHAGSKGMQSIIIAQVETIFLEGHEGDASNGDQNRREKRPKMHGKCNKGQEISAKHYKGTKDHLKERLKL